MLEYNLDILNIVKALQKLEAERNLDHESSGSHVQTPQVIEQTNS